MAEYLATWDTFSGGHWGAKGPRGAGDNQWGGANLILTRDGGLVSVTASRHLELFASTATNGVVWGMFWAWGIDGRIYYLQQTAAATYAVYRFLPDSTSSGHIEQALVGTTGTVSKDPDFTAVGTTLYMTVWGTATYAIDTGAGNLAALTGDYGAAPAGRAVCLYGDRLMVGGVSDGRFGTVPNRIVFSGDDTGEDTTDRTAWESLNYFDVGADNSQIVALLPVRDYLVVMTDDQQIWVVTGTPNVNITVRRVYGFHKGSGAVSAFQPSHAAVDPSQVRVWFYDHANRAPTRFNGATISRIEEFGTPTAERASSIDIDGPLAMVGGPDEFLVNNVALSRIAGVQTIDEELSLLRLNGVNQILLSSNLESRQTS